MAEQHPQLSSSGGNKENSSKPLRSPLKLLRNTASRISPTKRRSKTPTKSTRGKGRKSEENENVENEVPAPSNRSFTGFDNKELPKPSKDVTTDLIDTSQRRLSKNIDDMVFMLKEIDSRLLTMSVKESRDIAKTFIDSNEEDMKAFQSKLQDMHEAMISFYDVSDDASTHLPGNDSETSSDIDYVRSPNKTNWSDFMETASAGHRVSDLLDCIGGNTDLPEIPGFFSMCSTALASQATNKGNSFIWMRKYARPPTCFDLPSNECPIRIDQAYVDKNSNFIITVMVMNLDFHKKIICRWTNTIDWSISNDLELQHISNIPHKNIDFFRGTVLLPENSRRVEFAVRYSVLGKEFWDNNDGENFIIEKIDR